MAGPWRVEDSIDLYGIARWGRDYFTVNRQGHLAIRPTTTTTGYADVKEIVEWCVGQGLHAPLLLRFPQIIADRVKGLYTAFAKASKAYGYSGRLRAVFPMKVNQEKEVIEAVLEAGRRYDYGVEVGSKAELLAAVALHQNTRGLLICNGFKDYEFIELACYASLFRKNVILVIDKLDEVEAVIRAMRATGAKPWIGIRMKLYAKGGGKWVESGGERAKFGLNVPAILQAVSEFKKAKLIKHVRMLHFHIGSQITDIKKVHQSLREAARIYAELVRLKVPIKLIDCGGGLGLDYDGSQSTAAMSANYDLAEYANMIVYTLKSICDDAGVAYPDIVVESGRGIAGYHAMLVAESVPKGTLDLEPADVGVTDSDPLPLHELYGAVRDIGPKNFVEEYHDALTNREDMMSLFNLGQVDIDARARAEILFREVCRRVLRYLRREAEEGQDYDEELENVKKLLAHKYVANYSMFQSTPDVWGVKQLFPVAPIHRLDEEPTETGTICDLTCDSDGEVKRFIDVRTIKDVLELHREDGRPYYLGIMMLGAYQDVLGNFHNMFGPVNEAFVEVGRGGSWKVVKTLRGGTAADMLHHMNYDTHALTSHVQAIVANARNGATAEQAERFLKRFQAILEGYTYLNQPYNGSGGNV